MIYPVFILKGKQTLVLTFSIYSTYLYSFLPYGFGWTYGIEREIEGFFYNGFLWSSISPWDALVFFVCKKYGSLCMYILYKKMKKVIIKNKYYLSRMDDLLDQLKWTSYFCKIDLRVGYHQLRVKEDDMLKMEFELDMVSMSFSIVILVDWFSDCIYGFNE